MGTDILYDRLASHFPRFQEFWAVNYQCGLDAVEEKYLHHHDERIGSVEVDHDKSLKPTLSQEIAYFNIITVSRLIEFTFSGRVSTNMVYQTWPWQG